MSNKNDVIKDYDRWGKTCVKFIDNTPKKETPKKPVKTVKKGK